MGKWKKGKSPPPTPRITQSYRDRQSVSQPYINLNIGKILQIAQFNASEIVKDARKDRKDKIKTANAEAENEVLEYRNQKAQEYEKFEENLENTNHEIIKKIDDETNYQINRLSESADQKRKELVNQLVKMVCNIKPAVHPNFLLSKKIKEKADDDSISF